MSANPYDYENRKSIHPISWEDFHGICKSIAESASLFHPEIIVAIGRGGYYPGTLIAHMLQAELYPVLLSRRVNDVVTYKKPNWLVAPNTVVKGHRVLIVDEICSTGETISMVRDKIEAMGAAVVKSAVLYSHSHGSAVPDYIGIISDALILNPWDREIFKDGTFQFHPEYAGALAQQGLEADHSFLIVTPKIKLAKD